MLPKRKVRTFKFADYKADDIDREINDWAERERVAIGLIQPVVREGMLYIFVTYMTQKA